MYYNRVVNTSQKWGKKMDVLKRINQLRLERGWSIYRLSVKSGISQSTLTNMFNRETLPSITTLSLICDAFGISMAEFFSEPARVPLDAPDEAEFLRLYKSMPDTMKVSICDIMKEYQNK